MAFSLMDLSLLTKLLLVLNFKTNNWSAGNFKKTRHTSMSRTLEPMIHSGDRQVTLVRVYPF